MSEDIDDIVKKRLQEMEEDDAGSEQADEPSADEQQPNPEDDQGGQAPDGGEPEEKEAFSADSLDDFLKKTESKVTVKKEGCMPSPIFGNRDSKDHNKFRVFIQNPKGKVSFVFWDSIANTEKNAPLDVTEALADFGRCVQDYEDNPSFDEFKSAFGYDETEVDLAQKAYNGCRKMMDKAKKLFDDAQLDELKRLASEY